MYVEKTEEKCVHVLGTWVCMFWEPECDSICMFWEPGYACYWEPVYCSIPVLGTLVCLFCEHCYLNSCRTFNGQRCVAAIFILFWTSILWQERFRVWKSCAWNLAKSQVTIRCIAAQKIVLAWSFGGNPARFFLILPLVQPMQLLGTRL